MTVKENKAIVYHNYEQLNKRNLAPMDKNFAADTVWHTPRGREIHGLEEINKSLPDY